MNEQTFELVAEAWFLKINAQRKAEEVERDVRREFVARWRGRAVTSITRQEIAQIIEDKAEGRAPAANARKKGPAPAQARNLLGHAKQLFAWAVASGKYGLETSPAQLVQGRAIYGKKRRRSRVLKDDELRQVWNAVDQLEYQPSKGRAKGQRNRTTVMLKDAILKAATLIGQDGRGKNGLTGYLMMLATKERAVYARLLEKVLPMQLELKDKTAPHYTAEEAVARLRERRLPVPPSLLAIVGPQVGATLDATPLEDEKFDADQDADEDGSDDC